MDNLQQNVQPLDERPGEKSIEEYIIMCHNALINRHPGLKLRWSRIYGHRWAHIFGNSDDVSYSTFKIQLNPSYGVNIDNTGFMPSKELEEIISTLKRYFSDEIKL